MGIARDKIQQLLDQHPVMLFMKGTPSHPQCGFSAQVVQILQVMQVPFFHFDVLTDDDIRQGAKDYAQWPTIPQLYVRGKFIGGCDIIQELFKNNELADILSPS